MAGRCRKTLGGAKPGRKVSLGGSKKRRGTLTVGKLKALLEEMDPDAPVLQWDGGAGVMLEVMVGQAQAIDLAGLLERAKAEDSYVAEDIDAIAKARGYRVQDQVLVFT